MVSTSTYHTVGQGLSFDGSLTQDGAGRLELVGNAFKITGEIADIDDLKKVLASRFLRFSFQSAMTINLQSLSATCAVSLWFVGVCECRQTTSSTELFVVKKAVFIDAHLEAIDPSLPPIEASKIDVYLQEASPVFFCVANPLQSENGTCHRNRISCFSSPLCCQNSSLCRMAIGRGRQE